MLKKLIKACALTVGLIASTAANADLLDLKIGPAQIFDVQYQWATSSAPNTPNWGCYSDPTPCDVLNVSNLIAPYASTGPGGNFSHPNLTAGQYYGFINSTTNPGTYGMAVFNADGTQAYVIHDTGQLFKMSGDGIFYIGGGFFGTVITPSTGYAYGSSASLNVGLGTPTSADALAFSPPSSGILAAGSTAPPPFPVNTQAFDTGTNTSWTTGGGTGTQNSTAYTDVGVGVAIVQEMTSYQASGSTYSWTVKPPTGKYMFSIQPNNQQTAGVNDFNKMVSDLGLSATSKNEIIAAMTASGNGAPTNAAWIYQDITLSNGQTFKMAWQYISTDYEPYNDGSLTSLVNRTGTVVAKVNGVNKEYALLGFTNIGTGNYSVGSYGATGWQLAEYTANEAGTYRLGFAAFNLSDTALSPILFVSKDVGTTFNFATPFGPIAPNPGSSAPNNNTGPTVVSTAAGPSVITTSTASGVPVITSVTNTNVVNGVDGQGNPTVTTYYTVTTTTQTPTTTTTTTTPVTITTYSDGSTTSTNGTPTTVTTTSTTTTTNTTAPAVQSVATSVTTPGSANTVSSTVWWPTSSTTTTTYTKMPMTGKFLTVNKNTTVVTAHPSTTTYVTTTPITTTTTTVDGSGTQLGQTASTVNQVVSNTTDDTLYTASSANVKDSMNAMAIKDVMSYSRNNPFIVDALSTKDGPWAMPSVYRAYINGKLTGKNINIGYQKTVENNTVGFAFSGGEGDSSGYLNSKMTYENYAGTIYMLSKQDYFWVKASAGMSKGTFTSTNSLPMFAIKGTSKASQTNTYGDLTVYSPESFMGLRPFAGVTVVNSKVSSTFDTNQLVGTAPEKGSKTQANPYVGVRYEVDKDIGVELRATQTKDFKTVGGARVTVKKQVIDNVSVDFIAGADKGSKYNNVYGMIGLTWKF